MDPLIAEILAQPQEFTGENAVSYVTALRNSLGAMKAAAVQRVTIDSNMGENVSALLLTAQNLVQQVHPAALAIILFAQIDVLAEVDYRLYLNMCNILFRSILKDHVKFVFKESENAFALLYTAIPPTLLLLIPLLSFDHLSVFSICSLLAGFLLLQFLRFRTRW